MPKRGRAVGALIKYGPLVYAAAQRYGPAVWEQVRAHREPAERLVQQRVAKGNQRKKAMAHAGTLQAGSVLQVFHHNESHWVVFTGERPVAVHPATDTPFPELLADADLNKRVYPTDAVVSVSIKRPRRLAARPAGPPQVSDQSARLAPPQPRDEY